MKRMKKKIKKKKDAEITRGLPKWNKVVGKRVIRGVGNGGTLYTKNHPQRGFELALLGLSDVKMAVAFGVTEATITHWKNTHRKFAEALIEGKAEADAKVVHSLYKRATGFHMKDTHVTVTAGMVYKTPILKYYPPDTGAAIHWLNNRTRHLDNPWTSRQSVEVSGPNGGPIDIEKDTVSAKGLSLEEIHQLVELGIKVGERRSDEK